MQIVYQYAKNPNTIDIILKVRSRANFEPYLNLLPIEQLFFLFHCSELNNWLLWRVRPPLRLTSLWGGNKHPHMLLVFG